MGLSGCQFLSRDTFCRFSELDYVCKITDIDREGEKCNHIIKNENTLELKYRIFCRNSYLQAVCDTPIARIMSCVSS